MQQTSVLIIGCYRHTLPVAWALRDGSYLPVLGVRRNCREDRFVALSRVSKRLWTHSEFSDPRLVEELRAWLDEAAAPRLILPTGEASLGALMTLRRHSPHLASAILIPSDLCIERSLRKDLYASWAEELGLAKAIGLPPTRHARGLKEIMDSAQDIGFPVALKPAQSEYRLLGKKCIFLETPEELRALPTDGIADLDVVAQPRAKGRRRNLMFFASRGRLRSCFECEVLRTDVLNGTGYGVDVVSVEVHPGHRHAVEAIVSSFGWDGLGCVQFMFDAETGTSQFLEINPRIDANFALSRICGVNLVAAAVTDRVSGGHSGHVVCDYPVGKRLHWALGDLDGMREAGLRPSQRLVRLKEALWTLFRANGHSEFRPIDPLPGLYLGYRWTGSLVKEMLRHWQSAYRSKTRSHTGGSG